MFSERRLNQTILLALISTGLYIALIFAGSFDPKPNGVLQQTRPPFDIEATPLDETTRWLETVPTPFTVRARMTMTQADAFADAPAAYALVVGDAAQSTTLAIDPTSGFMSIWRMQEGAQHFVEPWHTWAHVNMEATHEFWLDVDEHGNITLRINRELYPISLAAHCTNCQIGVWSNRSVRVELFDIFHK